MKTWLCLGQKKEHSDKCIYSVISMERVRVANHPNSNFYHDTTRLSIYCKKKMHMIQRVITECDNCQNQTLEEFSK